MRFFAGIARADESPNWLIIRIQPDEGIALEFAAKRPGPSVTLSTVSMDFAYEAGPLRQLPHDGRKSRALRSSTSDVLSPKGLAKLRKVNVNKLPLARGTPRIGPCVGKVGNFIAIGLNCRLLLARPIGRRLAEGTRH